MDLEIFEGYCHLIYIYIFFLLLFSSSSFGNTEAAGLSFRVFVTLIFFNFSFFYIFFLFDSASKSITG